MFSRTVSFAVWLYVLRRGEIPESIPETVREAKQYERPRKIGNFLYFSQQTSSLLVVAGYWPGKTMVKHICWGFQQVILRPGSPAGARVKKPHVSYLSFPFADSEPSGRTGSDYGCPDLLNTRKTWVSNVAPRFEIVASSSLDGVSTGKVCFSTVNYR